MFTSVVFGNSAHPIMGHMKDKTFKRIPGAEGLFYARTNYGGVISYRKQDHTIQHHLSFMEFKNFIDNGTGESEMTGIYDIPSTDKWIGNMMITALRDDEVIS